jgi:hypothetical protein
MVALDDQGNIIPAGLNMHPIGYATHVEMTSSHNNKAPQGTVQVLIL